MLKQISIVCFLFLFLFQAATAQDLAVKGATILTMTNGSIPNGTLIIQKGKITYIGEGIPIPTDIKTIDLTDKYVIPGIIDTHVHYALYGQINEATDPVTPQIWMQDALVPDHDAILKVLAGGVTTVKTMHGSANVIGGVNVSIKMKYNSPLEEMIISDARPQLKMALGENPKRLYGQKGRSPSTRMGNAYIARNAFLKAKEYQTKWNNYEQNKTSAKSDISPPEKDLKMETLKMVLEKKLSIDCHCYRADEIIWIINFCKEFDVDLVQISHCIDGYKVADIMAEAGVSFGGWVDSWGFKEEAYDGCPWGFSIMHNAGTNIVINTDSVSAGTSRYLNLEAAKVLKYNDLDETDVLKMITFNAAKALEIDHRTGSLEIGKDGDIAVFDKHPLDSTSKCILTVIEGIVYFDHNNITQMRKGGSHGK
jgi:imidazolonepropionase-like amidohydrolase